MSASVPQAHARFKAAGLPKMVDAVDFYGGDGSREEFGEEFGRNDEEMDYKQLKANHEAVC